MTIEELRALLVELPDDAEIHAGEGAGGAGELWVDDQRGLWRMLADDL